MYEELMESMARFFRDVHVKIFGPVNATHYSHQFDIFFLSSFYFSKN